MGKVNELLRDVSRSTASDWIDRDAACEVINRAAGAVVFDALGLYRERHRAPTPRSVGGRIGYSRIDCEAFGQQIAERRQTKGAPSNV